MSSSISSQWIPTPRPMRRQFARCLDVARRSRGNQANGAETRRPSTSVTISSSSVHLTSTASATGLLAKVLIPGNDGINPQRRQTESVSPGYRDPHARRMRYPDGNVSARSRNGQASSLCLPNHFIRARVPLTHSTAQGRLRGRYSAKIALEADPSTKAEVRSMKEGKTVES